MKNIFLLITVSLFTFSGLFSAESITNEMKSNQDRLNPVITKSIEKQDIQTNKLGKKEIRKFIKGNRIKDNKRINKILSSNILLIGLALMIGGLLLYLIVAGFPWIGIITMVLGLVFLIVGLIKKYL